MRLFWSLVFQSFKTTPFCFHYLSGVFQDFFQAVNNCRYTCTVDPQKTWIPTTYIPDLFFSNIPFGLLTTPLTQWAKVKRSCTHGPLNFRPCPTAFHSKDTTTIGSGRDSIPPILFIAHIRISLGGLRTDHVRPGWGGWLYGWFKAQRMMSVDIIIIS